ncbi:MAG: saccharopine dehydrogenase [Alphaproteobacteria bacterium]|nr:saccharopine dehydrogenase [Alphaproteobacteria bacterium]
MSPHLHWIGAGLASGPGIVALANRWGQLTVWDMASDRAEALRAHITAGARLDIRHLDLDQESSRDGFCAALAPGDIIISMLPAALHPMMARLALAHGCHMVTSSYLSPAMRKLDDEAKSQGLSLVSEVGLDPGIDHLFAHMLMAAARDAGVLNCGRTLDFISCCGGFPVEKTAFTYKFSWTPIGVLTALNNPAKMIRDGQQQRVSKPWQAVTELTLDGEIFETYPNRDSLPYIAEYGLEREENLRTFVRGTLRLAGWKKAWQDIFTILETANSADLKALSDRLWRQYPYKKGERDRVVLYVALTATAADNSVWNAALTLDTTGSRWHSAMATTVSLTVAAAVNAVREHRLAPGVITAPDDISEVRTWLQGLKQGGLDIKTENIVL